MFSRAVVVLIGVVSATGEREVKDVLSGMSRARTSGHRCFLDPRDRGSNEPPASPSRMNIKGLPMPERSASPEEVVESVSRFLRG